MSPIIIILIIDTIAQVVFCHFSLWWIISLIARIAFCSRIIGATIKVKKLAIAEGIAFAAMFLFNWLFKGDNPMPWVKILLYFVFTAVAIGLEYLDDILYVYVIEDMEDND